MKKYLIISLLLLIGICKALPQSIPAFKEGDRIAFVGNSITCGGRYHSYIWLYYMTHFPNQRIDIFNEGVGGDVVGQMYQRLDKVFEHQPTVVTLSFGMNDVGYMDYTLPENDSIGNKNVETACNDYKQVEDVFKEHPNVRKILISSSPYDETSRFDKVAFPGKNKLIVSIGEFLQQRAKTNKWNFVDFNSAMVEINKREQKLDPAYTLCGRDRIHPSTDGHLVMAYQFLKEQGLANKPVADIIIDGSKRTVNRSENCAISDLSVSPQNISFTYLANSLPFPIDSSYYDNELHNQADALKVIPFMDEMNYEGMTVTGLEDGYYILKIEGRDIARLTSKELNRGINLATFGNTPQYEQAKGLAFLNESRWFMERQMREYYWMEYGLMRKTGMMWEGNEAAVDTVLKYRKIDPFVNWNYKHWINYRSEGIRKDCIQEQQDIVRQIYEANKPKALKVELIRL